MIEYSGKDNLDIMQNAVNYNNHLYKITEKFLNPYIHILDFGAGNGFFAEKFRINHKVYCIETDIGLQRILHAKNIPAFPDLSTCNESIEAAYSFNVIEHIDNDISALTLLQNKILPNGILVIYVPAFNLLYSSMDKKVGHFRRYRKKDLKAKLYKAGFDVLQANYVDSLGFFASLAYKWFGNKEGNINPGSLYIYDRFLFPVSLMIDKIVCNSFGKNLFVVAKKHSK